MVLPSLFTKSAKKSKNHDAPVLVPRPTPQPAPGPAPVSPDKPSQSRVRDRERSSASRRPTPAAPPHASRRSSKYDSDSHPLNLPPEERQRLSFTAIRQMSDQATPQPMDVDREHSSSPAPSSPVSASEPKPNGTPADRPAPPPHRYTKSPPPQSANYAATPEAATPPAEPPTIDAEEYKAAGNKFFKIKDYTAAIKEYSKGG